MNGRIWGIVAVFAGAAALLVVWLLVPHTAPPAVDDHAETAKGGLPAAAGTEPVRRAPVMQTRPLAIDAGRTRFKARDMALRQHRVADSDRMVTVPIGGVFALDQAGLSHAISNRKSDLQSCYDTSRLHTPALSEKMSLALRIEPEEGQTWGRVASVDSDSPLDATVLEGCITTVLEELRFDTIEPTTVRYPIAFSVGGE